MHPTLMTFVSSFPECLAVLYRFERVYILSRKALVWLPHFCMILCILLELYDILILSSNSIIKANSLQSKSTYASSFERLNQVEQYSQQHTHEPNNWFREFVTIPWIIL
jgi:hypothetical protein